MKTINLGLFGFGNVNRTLIELLQRKESRAAQAPRHQVARHGSRLAEHRLAGKRGRL